MNTSYLLPAVAAALLCLSACGGADKADQSLQKPEAAAAPAAANSFRASPDFGGVKSVTRQAEGIGSTPELAVLAALQSAVSQVNGVRIASQLQTMRSGLTVAIDGESASSVQSDAFIQQAIAASGGAVLGYRIVSQKELTQVDSETITRVRASDAGSSYKAAFSNSSESSAEAQTGDARADASGAYREGASVEAEQGASSLELDQHYKSMRSYWKVIVAADIAQYRGPKEDGRPKIVVSSPRTLSESYAVGDSQVPSDEVARAIRARLSDTLTQTRRFIVLDREFGSEMQAEIDHINSGNVRAIDAARVGQQLATDLILIPTIERFEYPRSTRELRMSSRKVVSYSGGGRLTLRLVNGTTGEVVMSESFEHQISPTGPSTLPRVVDGEGLANALMDELSSRMGAAIVSEIFPISVIALNGNTVVLSQGGDSLHAGERYQAVFLGDKLTDPQTGLSLGRMESTCCIVLIERVAEQTAYGVIEDVASVPTQGVFTPGSIQLGKQVSAKPPAVATVQNSGASISTGNRRTSAERPAAAPVAAAEDDKDW